MPVFQLEIEAGDSFQVMFLPSALTARQVISSACG